jgi:hypothetical protein
MLSQLKRIREQRGQRDLSSIATTITVIVAAIFVIGSNIA